MLKSQRDGLAERKLSIKIVLPFVSFSLIVPNLLFVIPFLRTTTTVYRIFPAQYTKERDFIHYF